MRKFILIALSYAFVSQLTISCKKKDAKSDLPETPKGILVVKGVRTTFCGPNYPQHPVLGALIMVFNKPCAPTIQNACATSTTNGDGNTEGIPLPISSKTYTIYIENKGRGPCSPDEYYVRNAKITSKDTTICIL